MSHLLRRHAPITSEGWARVDEEARERLTPSLGARRLVDFLGPHGWGHSATNLGRVGSIGADEEGIEARLRRVLPVTELRAPFLLSRDELQAGDRGAEDIDFGPLDEAARHLARTENIAVFHGWEAAQITGIVEASPHAPLPHGGGPDTFPALVATAVERLLRVGIGGPYGLALGVEMWSDVVETSEHGGYPLLRHLEQITGGPTVWTPGLDQAVLVSLRGGDFLFDCGQDVSVGYQTHDDRNVELYLEETFSFRAATPEAAISLSRSAGTAPARRSRTKTR
ncbi:MAG TPA: family 1 encapsulin nanocompartment shell protein [Gaiellaceae bacterium]|nr:family 1 encapsulin nanocompartment shell protein [Gaiellaceae bacterium]